MILRFSSLERVAGLRKGARIGLEWVESVHVDPGPWWSVRGLRVGTGIPFVALIGTMLRSGANDVVALRGRGPAVVVTLRPGARWQRWLFSAASMAEAERVVADVQRALQEREEMRPTE